MLVFVSVSQLFTVFLFHLLLFLAVYKASYKCPSSFLTQ